MLKTSINHKWLVTKIPSNMGWLEWQGGHDSLTAMDLTPEDTLRDAIARILRRRKRATTICYNIRNGLASKHLNLPLQWFKIWKNMENPWRVPMKMIYKSYKSWISRITPSKSGWNHQNVSHSMCTYTQWIQSHTSHIPKDSTWSS